MAVIDHLLGRLDEAQAGVWAIHVLDIIDRLHGELVRATTCSSGLTQQQQAGLLADQRLGHTGYVGVDERAR